METLGITRFEDLIGHLDGLTVAGRRSHVDKEAVAFVAQFRARLVRIHNYLNDKPAHEDPSARPHNKTVQDTSDFIEQFDALTDSARGAGLHPTLTHYLHTGRLRLRFALQGQGQRRLISRNPGEAVARIRWEGGETTGDLVDLSAYGLGVRTTESLDENTVVEAILEEEGRRRRYEALVVHRRPNEEGYFLGLEIFAIKQ